jgi:hypothetical protein
MIRIRLTNKEETGELLSADEYNSYTAEAKE